MENQEGHIDIYTDGTYTKGADYCGYAAIVVVDGYPVVAIYGAIWDSMYVKSWNVGGELKAAEIALDMAQRMGVDSVDIYHDYKGVSMWALGKWKCNKDLTRRYAQLMRLTMKYLPVKFHHVKGHSGNKFNELADRYAAKGFKYPLLSFWPDSKHDDYEYDERRRFSMYLDYIND